MEEILTNLYYNPLTGFQGLDKLDKKQKTINRRLKRDGIDPSNIID